MIPLYAVVTTHTTCHLRRALLGLARQDHPPQGTVVTVDNDHADIAALVGDCACEFSAPVLLVQRPFRGASRSSQVRNNGVRALLRSGLAESAHLFFLDGDCCPAPGACTAHRRLAESADVVVGFRIDLTPEQTDRFDDVSLARGQPPVPIDGRQLQTLRLRARRYRRHALLRRFGLIKAHKPKILSANFSVSLDAYRRVNGFDEEYLGYGGEDDDLGRRLYRTGAHPAIGVDCAIVYHLWHPTRAAADWDAAPGIARFKLKTPDRAAFGLDRPYDQPDPVITIQDQKTRKSLEGTLEPA